MASFPLVSATGMLGSGFRAKSLDKAISLGARMIGCDAGSTDPGPGPLATGTCMFSAAAVKRDTEIMMTRAVKAGIPLIIGSAGTSGSDAGLAWMVDIVHRDRPRAGPPLQARRYSLGTVAGGRPPALARRPGARLAALGAADRCRYRRGDPHRRDDGGRADPTGAEIGRANRRCRPQQRYLDLRGAAVARGLRPGRRVAHGQDPRMRRRRGRRADRARLHDGGAARGQLRRLSAARGLSLHAAKRRLAHALRKCRPVRA